MVEIKTVKRGNSTEEKFNRSWLLYQIDKALDSGDKKRFIELVKLLNVRTE